MDAPVEDAQATTRGLGEGVAETVGDRRRRDREQAAERSEDERDLVLRDQVLVVGDDLRGAARVIHVLHGHLVAEQAALGVLVMRPEVVALDEGLAVPREIPGQRYRDADRYRRCLGRAAGGRTAAAASRKTQRAQ